MQQAYAAVETETSLEDLFPSTNVWVDQLGLFLAGPVNPSISITNSLAGAAFLACGVDAQSGLRVARDRQGRAVPIRMALYVNQLIQAGVELTKLPQQFQIELLYLLSLTVQLVSDQITCLDGNRLWQTLGQTEFINQAENFVSSTRALMNNLVSSAKNWIDGVDDGSSSVVLDLVKLATEKSRELTPQGLYSARSLCELVQALTEVHGSSASVEQTLLTSDYLKVNSSSVLPASAFIVGLGEALQSSKSVDNFCNKIVSEVAGAKPQGEKTLIALILLSSCAQIYDSGELPVANNRIVFAVRQITSWLDEPDALSPAFCSEVCRALTKLLPCMKDVYGSYWEKTIEFCISSWNKAGDHPLEQVLPFIHSSLRLMKTLESLQDPNDDLQDALKEFDEAKSKALIELLRLDRELTSQPLDIVDGVLCREIDKIPIRHIPDLSELFGLVASESRAIQTAAFTLLHRAIPAQQEQKSIDVLLDKKGEYYGPDESKILLTEPQTHVYPMSFYHYFLMPQR